MDAVATAKQLRTELNFALIYLRSGHRELSGVELNPAALLHKSFTETEFDLRSKSQKRAYSPPGWMNGRRQHIRNAAALQS